MLTGIGSTLSQAIFGNIFIKDSSVSPNTSSFVSVETLSSESSILIKQPNSSKISASSQSAYALPLQTQKIDEFLITAFNQGLTNGYNVFDSTGWVATFTNGSRSVALRGSSRVFAEKSGTPYSISHNIWVRLLNEPFTGNINTTWLRNELANKSDDILSISMQYTDGAPTLKDTQGSVYASDADYGPLTSSGTREEGSDFNDYLGIPWTYRGVTDSPDPNKIKSLDCSGYMRMLWGYRLGIPLAPADTDQPNTLPRRAVQMEKAKIGNYILTSSNVKRFDYLQPGDLLFFNVSTDDGTAVDHVGMYIGKDSGNNYRFISSRKTANGPTMGDLGGKSIVNGSGFYASGLVSAKRL